MKANKLRQIGCSIGATILLLVVVDSGAAVAGTTRTPDKSQSLLQQGKNYYRGKTLTFADYSTPGTGVDTSDRILAPYLAQYLHATVNIENIPGGNAVQGADVAAASPHNGLTIGQLDTLNLIEQYVEGLPGLTFSLTKQDYVGSTQPETSYGWAESNAKNCPDITNWNAFIKYGSSTSPVRVITETSGTTTTLADFALATFKPHVQLVTGYPKASALTEGFERGDACFITAGASDIFPFLTSGFAHALAISSPAPPGEGGAFAGTPTMSQLIKQDKKLITTRTQSVAAEALKTFSVGLGSTLFLPRGTPADEVAAIEAAVKWTAHNTNFIKAELAANTATKYSTPSTDLASIERAIKTMKPFKSIILGS